MKTQKILLDKESSIEDLTSKINEVRMSFEKNNINERGMSDLVNELKINNIPYSVELTKQLKKNSLININDHPTLYKYVITFSKLPIHKAMVRQMFTEIVEKSRAKYSMQNENTFISANFDSQNEKPIMEKTESQTINLGIDFIREVLNSNLSIESQNAIIFKFFNIV